MNNLPQTQNNEIIEVDAVEVIEAQSNAEIDRQIATANAYPRELSVFHKKAIEYATYDEDIASSITYALPRGGKTIEGPSVRLAEIVANTYKNLRVDAKIISIDKKQIVAQATAMDLENNTAVRTEVRAKITYKDGRRYNDDMINTTGNAASAKAYRNAVFKIVPFALIKPIIEEARKVAVGTEKTLATRRDAAIQYFESNGIDKAKVLKVIGKKDIHDITLDDLATLKGIITAVKEGHTTLDETFNEQVKEEKEDKLNQKLKEKKEQAQEQEASTEKEDIKENELKIDHLLDNPKAVEELVNLTTDEEVTIDDQRGVLILGKKANKAMIINKLEEFSNLQ